MWLTWWFNRPTVHVQTPATQRFWIFRSNTLLVAWEHSREWPKSWAPALTRETHRSSWLLPLNWHSLDCCNLLGSELVERRFFYLSLSVSAIYKYAIQIKISLRVVYDIPKEGLKQNFCRLSITAARAAGALPKASRAKGKRGTMKMAPAGGSESKLQPSWTQRRNSFPSL